MRRLANIPGITFALFLLWQAGLLLFTAQPVPANDSFFYDGPVVNYLLHGKYCNPSLALVLPISGSEVFCAYPPLYQLGLLGWMKVFGPGALAAMWLHSALLGVYTLTVLGIFRRLQAPAAAVNLAGLFLFALTFHDRPDSLAHVLGMAAVYAVIRSRQTLDPAGDDSRRARWSWLTVALSGLTLCASLQIGGFYFVFIWLLRRLCKISGNEPLPKPAMLATWLIPIALVGLVRFGFPHWWAGFREHAQITPSLTGLRVPTPAEFLKIIRAVPGVLVIAVSIRWAMRRGGLRFPNPILLVLVGATLPALAVVAGALTVLTSNLVAIASYAQPLVVGLFLAALAGARAEKSLPRVAVAGAFALGLLVSVRAIGMTTWGALCSRDVSYATARQRVNEALDSVPTQSAVVVSAAYLYDVARRDNLRWIHSDWPSRPSATNPDWVGAALRAERPAALVLTQFDYYRRYQAVLNTLTNQSVPVGIRVRDFAQTPTPDSLPALQKVVQHISWAPVVIDFDWSPAPK